MAAKIITIQNAMTLLSQAVSQNVLPTKDVNFAKSLLNGYKEHGHLTDKQVFWVKKLISGVVVGQLPAVADNPPDEVDGLYGVIKLFKAAQQHLKYPKINLQLLDGSPIQLSLAGKAAKQPGTVNVTDGKAYGHNFWYGRVLPEGIFVTNKKIDLHIEMKIVALLMELAKDPAKVAAAHGKLTGNCCFCNSPLTDPKSTEVGYGRVCAAYYHLPWGKYGMVTPKKFVSGNVMSGLNFSEVNTFMEGLTSYLSTTEAGSKTPVVVKGSDYLPAPASVTPAYMLSEVELDARMKDLFAKFEGDQEAIVVLNKLRDRARMEREDV